jgi:hypothetical protein
MDREVRYAIKQKLDEEKYLSNIINRMKMLYADSYDDFEYKFTREILKIDGNKTCLMLQKRKADEKNLYILHCFNNLIDGLNK